MAGVRNWLGQAVLFIGLAFAAVSPLPFVATLMVSLGMAVLAGAIVAIVPLDELRKDDQVLQMLRQAKTKVELESGLALEDALLFVTGIIMIMGGLLGGVLGFSIAMIISAAGGKASISAAILSGMVMGGIYGGAIAIPVLRLARNI